MKERNFAGKRTSIRIFSDKKEKIRIKEKTGGFYYAVSKSFLVEFQYHKFGAKQIPAPKTCTQSHAIHKYMNI